MFETHLGFYEAVVAAPSQKAALAAWGTHQDLFREGIARETRDKQAKDAALEVPGRVLLRPAGTALAFRLKPELPKVPRRDRVGSSKARRPPGRAARH